MVAGANTTYLYILVRRKPMTAIMFYYVLVSGAIGLSHFFILCALCRQCQKTTLTTATEDHHRKQSSS